MTNLLYAAGGWIVAAFLAGFAWGERQRRLDCFRREGIPVGRPAKAKVQAQSSPVPAVTAAELEDAKRRYIADAEREGYNGKAAARDFDDMMAAAHTDQIGVMTE